MQKIYGVGEALLDVIFRNNQPVAATAGGSTLNAIVSLGRIGYKPCFISKLGNDRVGDIISGFLAGNGVEVNYIERLQGYRSPLALAFLDQHSNATFDIYKDKLPSFADGEFPRFKPGDVVLFGSIFSLNAAVRPWLLKLLESAKSNGAMIIYDPNYRSSHGCTLEQMIPAIEENLSMATIVRGSNEDFQSIYNVSDIHVMAERILKYCPNVIITSSAAGVHLFNANWYNHFAVPPVTPVSTIGAGDSFNAGLVHGLVVQKVGRGELGDLPVYQWQKVVETATAFAVDVCCSLENYVSDNFAAKYKIHTGNLQGQE